LAKLLQHQTLFQLTAIFSGQNGGTWDDALHDRIPRLFDIILNPSITREHSTFVSLMFICLYYLAHALLYLQYTTSN
jgi:hypothetical protein